jgi:hypothetical protein
VCLMNTAINKPMCAISFFSLTLVNSNNLNVYSHIQIINAQRDSLVMLHGIDSAKCV